MTKHTRRNHAPAFKAQVALAPLKGEKTLASPGAAPMPPLREAEAGAALCRARSPLLHNGMAGFRSGVSAEWG